MLFYNESLGHPFFYKTAQKKTSAILMVRDQLDGLLTCEVLDVKPQHEHMGKVLVNLALQARVIMRRMAKSQPAQCSQPFVIILNDVDLAEGDNTLEVGRERLGMHLILGDDTE